MIQVGGAKTQMPKRTEIKILMFARFSKVVLMGENPLKLMEILLGK